MSKHHRDRSAIARKYTLLFAATVLAPLAFASSAMAEHHPKGVFAPFAQCPLSSVEICTVAFTTSGGFTVGTRTVPIVKTITLQGGVREVPETGEDEIVAAENGETLTKVPLYVPGGLFNILPPGWLNKEQKEAFEEAINHGPTGLTETTELAQPASAIRLNPGNLIFESGTALKLPIKVKLGNSLLGSNCYVGSATTPVILNLTTGETSPPEPNKPIHGNPGELSIEAEGALLILNGGSLVDNAWAAPGASGCGGPFLEGVIDAMVDSQLGLPAAAGHNSAVLTGKLELALAEAVKASE